MTFAAQGFAITGYTVSDLVGGPPALAQFRGKLAKRGIRLMLDFVPNHTAPDHPWVKSHPDYYVQGDEQALARAPQNFLRVATDQVLQFSPMAVIRITRVGPIRCSSTTAIPHCNRRGWTSWSELRRNATVYGATWRCCCCPRYFNAPGELRRHRSGRRRLPQSATRYPSFMFMAEVYWDLEWTWCSTRDRLLL